jgi:hypothetical protein
MITRRSPKNVIIRVHREQSQNGKNYSESEKDSKRKSIILKILQDLKKKHKNLFNNLIVNEIYIKEDLFILIKEEDLAKFDYVKFLAKAEQECIFNRIEYSKRNYTYLNNNTHMTNNELDSDEKKIKESNRSYNNTNTTNDSSGMGTGIVNDSMKNYNLNYNYANNFNSNSLNLNTLHTNNKYDELKNYKEKDEWAIMLKKQHLDFLNEKLNKLKQQEYKKKEITQILANQIAEKNYQKQNKITNDEKFNENWNKEIENWKKTEIKMKEKNENKIREFIEERDNVYKSTKIFFLIFNLFIYL